MVTSTTASPQRGAKDEEGGDDLVIKSLEQSAPSSRIIKDETLGQKNRSPHVLYTDTVSL